MSSDDIRYFVVTFGEPNLNEQGKRSTTLYRFPPNGSTLLFDDRSSTGFTAATPTQILESAVQSGGAVPATSITLLTIKGQLLSSSGGANVVLAPPGADGKILTTDASTPTGLRWADPSAATGNFGPVDGLAARDTVGLLAGVLQATRFVSYVEYVDATSVSLASNSAIGGSLGTTANRFHTAFTTIIDSPIVKVDTINPNATVNITLTAAAGVVSLNAAAANLTLSATALTPSVPIVIPQNQNVIFRDGTKQLWRFVIDGTDLVSQFNTGTDGSPNWVTKHRFSSS